MTDAEHALWRYLRRRLLDGHKLRRQVPIGPYIADFVCLKARLVIEVDGGQHADAQLYDSRRDDFMRGQGYRISRFWNNEVLGNIEGVWDVIASEINAPHRAAAPPIPTFPHPSAQADIRRLGGRGSPSR